MVIFAFLGSFAQAGMYFATRSLGAMRPSADFVGWADNQSARRLPTGPTPAAKPQRTEVSLSDGVERRPIPRAITQGMFARSEGCFKQLANSVSDLIACQRGDGSFDW